MRNITSRSISVLMLFLMTTILGCASLQALSAPPSPNLRKWRFSPDKPALLYSYNVCVKKFLWNCTKTEVKTDVKDLTDPVVRKELIAMDFIAMVREKPIP